LPCKKLKKYPMKKRIHFENLDGLRFLCFLSVFFYHSFHTNLKHISSNPIYQFITKEIFGNGNLGVNFFFVLSGFLITYLLIEEKKMNGRIDIRKFWVRRILRIWPLFYFCVFFGFVLFPWLKEMFGQTPNETANLWTYLVFINNFDMIKNGMPDSSVLGVLWSVAIEEQFYLTWPVILSFFSLKRYWIPFVVIILSSLIFRSIYTAEMYHENHTLSCIGDMATGATGAWLISTRGYFLNFIKKLNRFSIAFIYILFIFVFFFRDEVLYANYYIRIFERFFIAVVILFVILEQNYAERSFFKMSYFKNISRLGVITYGLYCLHFVGILSVITITNMFMINTQLWQVLIVETALALSLTIFLSYISYRFYEKPFLKFKDKFAYIIK